MIKNLGIGCYCKGSEAECLGFPHGYQEAATAPGMLFTFKKEGGKLAPASGSINFLSSPLTPNRLSLCPFCQSLIT